jgi:hypothetical protein
MRVILFIGLPDSWRLQQLLEHGFGVLQECMMRSGKCLLRKDRKTKGRSRQKEDKTRKKE